MESVSTLRSRNSGGDGTKRQARMCRLGGWGRLRRASRTAVARHPYLGDHEERHRAVVCQPLNDTHVSAAETGGKDFQAVALADEANGVKNEALDENFEGSFVKNEVFLGKCEGDFVNNEVCLTNCEGTAVKNEFCRGNFEASAKKNEARCENFEGDSVKNEERFKLEEGFFIQDYRITGLSGLIVVFLPLCPLCSLWSKSLHSARPPPRVPHGKIGKVR